MSLFQGVPIYVHGVPICVKFQGMPIYVLVCICVPVCPVSRCARICPYMYVCPYVGAPIYVLICMYMDICPYVYLCVLIDSDVFRIF